MLPQASVALQWRVIAFVLPQRATNLCVDVIATLPHVSIPVAVPVAAGVVSPVHSTVALGGTLRLGLVVLPQPPTTVSVNVIATLPHVSLPVAVPVAAGVVSPVHSIVALGGTVRLGLVVSPTAMV